MWDKLKGAIFEDEGPKADAPKPATAATAPKTGGTAPTMTNFSAPSLNTAMVEAITKATFSRNTALTNLIAQAKNFEDVIPDPTMRLKAAHKASGARSAKEISDAVAIHLQDVDGEEMRFAQALNGKKQNELGALQRNADQTEQSIGAMQNEIGSLSQRIQQLQQNIGESTAKLSQMRTDISVKEGEYQRAELEFKAAADHVRGELNGHKNSITSTLG